MDLANSDGFVSIILARGGSKRIPNKNLQPLGGTTILERAIAVSHAAGVPTICSSDSLEILELADAMGALCIERPLELASDYATDQQNFVHIWRDVLANPTTVSGLVFLRPTLPFRLAEDIRRCCEEFVENDYALDSVRTVRTAPYPPYWMKKIDEQHGLVPITADFECFQFVRSQDLPKAVICDGHCDIINPKNIAEGSDGMYGSNVRPVFSSSKYFVDIDEPEDLEVARALMASFKGE